MDREINVLALVKGEERYVFLYDDNNRVETLRMLGRYAADPQLSFTWYDAAVMSKKIREIANAVACEEHFAAQQHKPQPQDTRHYQQAQASQQLPRFSFRTKEDLI